MDSRWVCALVLVGCGAAEEAPTCDASVVSTWPASGDQGVYHRSNVEFTFDRVLTQAEVDALVVDAPVRGTLSLRAPSTVVWTPNEPLAPESEVTVALSGCGEAQAVFRTSAVGQPLQGDIVGQAFQADLADARYYTNESISDLVTELFGGSILAGVTDAGGGALDLRLALGDGQGNQDFCSRTRDLPPLDFGDSPFFTVGPTDLEMPGTEGSLTLIDMRASGSFSADGSRIAGLAFSAKVDLREAATFPDAPDADAMCGIIDLWNVPCDPCADGAPYCVSLEFDDLAAEAVDIVVETVEPNDPRCEE